MIKINLNKRRNKMRRNGDFWGAFSLFGIFMFIFFSAVACYLFFYGFIICTAYSGNFYFTDEKALEAISVDHPEYIKVVLVKRNVYALSKVVVENEQGERKTFFLDTDILQNIEVQTMNKED
jgi:hypothetical protein